MTSSANRQYVFEKNQDYWDADSINFDRIGDECYRDRRYSAGNV